jgi:hypothetical protein
MRDASEKKEVCEEERGKGEAISAHPMKAAGSLRQAQAA